MRSRIWIATALLAGSCALTGCGGVEGELLAALRTKEQRAFCVGPNVLGVDAFEGNDGKRYLAKAGEVSFMGSDSSVAALDRLKAKGYASQQATSLQRSFASMFDAFELTSKGDAYFRPDAFAANIEVCIGEHHATEIVDFAKSTGGGPETIQARFRYDVRFNDLVDDLGITDPLRAEMRRRWPGEGEAFYTKTNKGWRLEHASWH